ncbi:MAG TPA: hypothetical protein VKB79_20015 [Bryobacteraceae bacterium]|nr:hypothetical protein [Bryobacteraceae bacterium]
MKSILLLAVTALAMLGADATGTWTGTLTPTEGDAGPAHLVLKQDGGNVTGTAGPNADEQHEIRNGKVKDGKISFELGGENGVMRFELTQEGDQIRGDVSREHEGQTQTAKLSVTRSK